MTDLKIGGKIAVICVAEDNQCLGLVLIVKPLPLSVSLLAHSHYYKGQRQAKTRQSCCVSSLLSPACLLKEHKEQHLSIFG